MSDAYSEQVETLKEILSYPFLITRKLQCSNLTQGSFPKEWKILFFHLTQNGGLLAEEIRDSMILRESILLDNEILLAAIYVYPMYRVSLTKSKTNKAKATLFNIAIEMTGLDKKIENPV